MLERIEKLSGVFDVGFVITFESLDANRLAWKAAVRKGNYKPRKRKWMSMTVCEETNAEKAKIVGAFAAGFERLHVSTCDLMRLIPQDKLYWQPRPSSGDFPIYSCGEHVLRSAAAIEQTFGGITANLWDDPFEWTLPETLLTPDAIIGYMQEAADMRRRGIALLRRDSDLCKEIATAIGERQSIGSLLAETLIRAAHHHGQSFSVFRMFSDARLPRL